MERADHVRVDKVARTGNRTVDVRLGCKVDHVRDIVRLHDRLNSVWIPEVDRLEDIFRMLVDAAKVFEMPGVGQAIEVNERLDLR